MLVPPTPILTKPAAVAAVTIAAAVNTALGTILITIPGIIGRAANVAAARIEIV